MVVVVEYVIIDNIVVNAILLYLTFKLLKQDISKWKVLLAASVGAGFALVSPLINLTGAWAFLVKLPVGLILVVLAGLNIKRLFAKYIVFLLATFLFGGACLAIFALIGVSAAESLTLTYSLDVPLGVILIAVVMLAWVLNACIKAIYKRKSLAGYIHTVSVTLNDKTVVVNGFLDSGNRLTDSKTEMPIVIMSADLLEKWFTKEQCLKLLLGKTEGMGLANPHFIKVNSVGGKCNMLVFEAQGFSIKDETDKAHRVCLGITYKKFRDVFDAKVLLNPLLVN